MSGGARGTGAKLRVAWRRIHRSVKVLQGKSNFGAPTTQTRGRTVEVHSGSATGTSLWINQIVDHRVKCLEVEPVAMRSTRSSNDVKRGYSSGTALRGRSNKVSKADGTTVKERLK